IYKVDSKGKLSVFASPAGFAKGLMVNRKGEIVACEMNGRVVAHDAATGKVRILAGQYKGVRFNAPSHLVIDKTGAIYFTVPSLGRAGLQPQGQLAVYCIGPDGKLSRIIDDLPTNPNGITLAPDEKPLYVLPSNQSEMMAYPVEGPGKVGKGRVFCSVRQP